VSSVALVVVVIATGIRAAHGQCVTPSYRTINDRVGASGGAIYLSIDPRDLSLNKLVCLASAVHERHSAWDNVDAYIVTSDTAADRYFPTAPTERGDFRRDLRALYSVEHGKASLTITPIGTSSQYFKTMASGKTFGDEVYDTAISIPAKLGLRCRLSVANRCVFALQTV
jgi:uncharacterized protein involved in tellurium resistance